MEIIELEKDYTQSQLEDLRSLIAQLTDRITLTEEKLRTLLASPDSHLYIIIDDQVKDASAQSEPRIVGCATLCLYYSPTGTKASIEDVVVAESHRGQHLGRKLVTHLMEQARQYAPIDVYLTSNPRRVAANNLYQSLGFQRKETNCYRISIGSDSE